MESATSRVTPLREGDLDRIPAPPANIEAEQALLGAIFTNNAAYGRISDFLRPEHFANALHGRVYAAIGRLLDRGDDASPITLRDELSGDAAFAEAGGAGYLGGLRAFTVSVRNAEHYGRRLVRLAKARALAEFGQQLIDAASGSDLDPILTEAADRLRAVEEIGGHSFVEMTIASQLAASPPPDRACLVPDWIPRRQVTLLGGDGGTGKSLLAMQLQLATAVSGRWQGLYTMRCRSFGLYAEDEQDELHRRLYSIAALAGVDVADLDDMAWRSAVADDPRLVSRDDRGALRPTAYWHQIERAVLNFGARLVVLDAAANLFGGDEIRRGEVNEFIGMLRRLAIKIDGAVVLLSHPSIQGISSGSGLSGSTAWNNSVRSRLYFERTKGDDADPDERVLSRLKSNYASAGESLRVRWSNGGFVPLDAPGGIDRLGLSAKADRTFLSLLRQTYSEGSWVCPSLTARNYAPTIFSRLPGRDGLSKLAFEGAMRRLLQAGQIGPETYGRPAEPRFRLALK